MSATWLTGKTMVSSVWGASQSDAVGEAEHFLISKLWVTSASGRLDSLRDAVEALTRCPHIECNWNENAIIVVVQVIVFIASSMCPASHDGYCYIHAWATSGTLVMLIVRQNVHRSTTHQPRQPSQVRRRSVLALQAEPLSL